MNKRKKGGRGEELVRLYYIDHGYTHLVSNYTIPGGEIDIVVEDAETLVFIEVKVVDHIDDLFGYVTEKKLYFVHKTIAHYLREFPTKKNLRIDVVFVKHNRILEIYENVGGK